MLSDLYFILTQVKRYEETLHQFQKDLERAQENHRNATVQVCQAFLVLCEVSQGYHTIFYVTFGQERIRDREGNAQCSPQDMCIVPKLFLE